MSDKKNPLGPTGETVRANVSRLRGRLQYKELSERLSNLGRPIPPLGLRRIEAGERRVDADDLMALAVALGVPPNSLLLPHVEEGDSVAVTAAGEVPMQTLWDWADGLRPLEKTAKDESPGERHERRLRSRPHYVSQGGELRTADYDSLIERMEEISHDLASYSDRARAQGRQYGDD